MIFSMPVVQRLVDECRCPGNDSPDDMILGMCLKRMEIPITHVPYIHQVMLAVLVILLYMIAHNFVKKFSDLVI